MERRKEELQGAFSELRESALEGEEELSGGCVRPK